MKTLRFVKQLKWVLLLSQKNTRVKILPEPHENLFIFVYFYNKIIFCKCYTEQEMKSISKDLKTTSFAFSKDLNTTSFDKHSVIY